MKKLTIDPGIQGTGWALWDFKWRLQKAGVIHAPSRFTWEEKMKFIGHKLTDVTYGVEKVYIEYPKKFGGAGGDMVANRGDLVKLATFVGYLLGYLKKSFELVPVNQWKGQLPKNIVNDRIVKCLHPSEINKLSKNKSHDWDAVGIALHVQGVF